MFHTTISNVFEQFPTGIGTGGAKEQFQTLLPRVLTAQGIEKEKSFPKFSDI
jgi:hypothetical protein